MVVATKAQDGVRLSINWGKEAKSIAICAITCTIRNKRTEINAHVGESKATIFGGSEM